MRYAPRHEAQEVLVELRQTRIATRSLVTCDDCGGRARWSTNAGYLCCACCRRKAREAEGNRYAYGLDYSPEPVACALEQLAECGFVTARPSSNPTCSQMHYHPLPEVAAAELALPDVNRQAQAVARILWGLGLAVGADMAYWPRDAAYVPAEVGYYREVISWALESRSRLVWLLMYAGALMDRHTTAQRKDGRVGAPPHKSLQGAVGWWVAALKMPEIAWQIPVVTLDECDWPPVRNHPAVLAAKKSRSAA